MKLQIRRAFRTLQDVPKRVLLFTILLAILLVVPPRVEAQEPLRIGRITVTTFDVYTPQEAAVGWAYKATNRLHMQTRESVVRRFLLFSEGDVYDQSQLEQTERNLRALDFIKSASVTAGEPHDGLVDVYVITQDSWTTEPGLNFGSSGGSTNFGFELQESNLFGLGKQLVLLYDNNIERTRRGIQYRDPSFVRPYWTGDFLLTDNSDGSEQRVSIRRPFYTFDRKWSFQAFVDRFDKTTKLYANSYVESQFQTDERRLLVAYGRAIAPNMKRAYRLTTGLDWIDDDFRHVEEAPDAVLPDERDFHYVFGQFEYTQNGFVKINYVNRDDRFEDINLGTQFLLKLGISPEGLGADDTTGTARLVLNKGHAFGENAFVLADTRYETRIGGATNRNAIAGADIRFVRRIGGVHPQAFASRLHLDRGWDLDRDVQFFADGDTGLRGYRLYAFEGDKTMIVNLEHRVFLGRELWQAIQPGVAIFVDTGAATPKGVPLSLGSFRTDVGVGLRIGITRSSRNMVRFDLAYALDEDPRGEKGFMVSFSSSQAF